MTCSDASLTARVIVDDDRHAFGEIVRRHQSQVRSFLRKLTSNDPCLADDLAQETFLRAYRGLRGYRGTGKLSSWLCQIAYRAFLSHLATRHQRVVSEDLLPENAHDVDQTDLSLRWDLQSALSSLRPEERAAIAAAYGQGFSHAEAAEVLGWPLGTLKTHVARAQEKLARKLRPWSTEEPIHPVAPREGSP